MNSKKINLLHTVLNLGVGGLERLVYETSLLMSKHNYDIEVVCLNRLGEFADALMEHGIKVTLLQKKQTGTDLFYPRRLKKFLMEKNIDILQMHSGTFLYGSIAARLAKTKVVVYTDHGRPLKETKIGILEDRLSARYADKIIAVSNELREHLVKVVGLPKKKIITIINGINTEEFAVREKSVSLLEEFNLSSDSKVIGTLGRLRTVKDHKSLIEAFELVIRKIPEARLMLVGDGNLKAELESLAAKRNLTDKVIFAGIRKDVPQVLNLLDVFVLSSLSEGTSISLLEAMASGLPAVVTNVGGNPSLISHNDNGLVVEPKNIEQMAQAIIEILEDEEKYNKFQNNTLAITRQKYSIASMIANYEKVYFDILNNKTG